MTRSDTTTGPTTEPTPEPSPGRPEEGPRLAHRTNVVRRLLTRGLDPETLTLLLPSWESVIDQVALSGDEAVATE